MKTILIDINVLPECTAILKEAGHAIIGPMPTDTSERRAAFATANAIIIASAWQIDDAALAMAPHLQVVGRPGIGIDNVDTDACTRHGVCVVHTPDAPTQATAEHAFTLLLALAKQLRRVDADFRSKGWDSKSAYGPGVELKGATLGLVGLGRIGGTVAKMAHGFDMRVIVFDPFISDERAHQIRAERKATLGEVLSEADFISLHSALTPQTRGLIGKAELAMMKPTAYLINCSRGPVIDEAALLDALRERRIAGAGLDVFTVEPTPPDNPLLQLDNVLVTPHLASRTFKGVYDMNVGIAHEVNAVLRGEHPRWLANREVWAKRRMKAEG